MDILSDELLCSVLAFLPDVADLKAFALASSRWYAWIFTSEAADGLFLELYQRQFRPKKPWREERVSNPHTLRGKQLWKNLYNIQHSIKQRRRQHGHCPQEHNSMSTRRPIRSLSPAVVCFCQSSPCAAAASVPRSATSLSSSTTTTTTVAPVQALHTIEILPVEEEAEAILYDNHDLDVMTDDTDGLPCVGYFGLRPLAGGNVAVWGDFAGLRVAPSWDALLNPRSQERDRLVAIHDEKQSQVMGLRVNPKDDRQFFLGFASGVVMALVLQDGDAQETQVKSSCTSHSFEITCLAIVPDPSRDDHPGYLVSACVNGDVCLYPRALTELDLEYKVRLHETHDAIQAFPVYTMSATVFGHTQSVLCLGGQGHRLQLWQLQEDDCSSHGKSGGLRVVGVQYFEYEDPEVDFSDDDEVEDAQTDHNATCVTFVGPLTALHGRQDRATPATDFLVLGTSRGRVMVWDLVDHAEDMHRPYLELRHCYGKVQAGCVESIERVGNMVFTTGGREGVVKVIDLVSRATLATLLVHPGRMLAPQRPAVPVRLKCAVITSWVCHERQSIICLCRDGHIGEWSFQVQTLPAPNTIAAAAKHSLIGLPKTGKRARKSVNALSALSHAISPNVATKVPVETNKEYQTSRRRKLRAANEQNVEAPRTIAAAQNSSPNCNEICTLLKALKAYPDEAKDLFKEVGFVRWRKRHLPVLVLSPLDVPAGPVREAWLRAYHKYQNSLQNGSHRRMNPSVLVHWYGSENPKRAYSLVPCTKFIPYEQCVAKGLQNVTDRLQQRMTSGKAVSSAEREYLQGIQIMQQEVDIAPSNRSHLLRTGTKNDDDGENKEVETY